MLICIRLEILVGLLGGEPLRKSILFIWGVSLGEEILSDLFREYSPKRDKRICAPEEQRATVGCESWVVWRRKCVRQIFPISSGLRKIVCGTPEGVPGCLETAFLRPVTSWLHKRKQNK